MSNVETRSLYCISLHNSGTKQPITSFFITTQFNISSLNYLNFHKWNVPVIVSQLPSTCTMKEKGPGELSVPSPATPNSTAQTCCSSSLIATENQNCYCKLSLLRSTGPSYLVYFFDQMLQLPFFLLHFSVRLLFKGSVISLANPLTSMMTVILLLTVECYQ